LREFERLMKLRREFWVIQTLSSVLYLFYGIFVTISILYLTNDIGFDDVRAGQVVAIFLTGAAIVQVCVGPMIDQVGLRKASLVAVSIISVGCLGVGATPYVAWSEAAGKVIAVIFFLVAALGTGLFFPIPGAGTKRFSNRSTEAPAFSLHYLSINMGFALVFILDFMRRPLADNPTKEQIMVYSDAGGNTHVFFALISLCVVAWAVTYFFLRSEEPFPEFGEAKSLKLPSHQSFFQIAGEVIHDREFHRVFVVLMFTIPAHMTLMFPLVLYPKYWVRVLGGDAPIGFLSSINPVLIIISLILFSPLVTMSVKRFSTYWTLVGGMIVGGSSTLILSISPYWVAEALGADVVGAYYILIFTQMLVFVVGESVWSPQLLAYVAHAAPLGKEGAYMGFSRVAFTIAKAVAGGISGYFLLRYCPEGIGEKILSGELAYTESPEFMFLILALITLLSPVILIAGAKWLNMKPRVTHKII